MNNSQTKLIRLALVAMTVFYVSLPVESFADLNGIACRAIRRGCLGGCGRSPSQSCAGSCENDYANCIIAGVGTKKQQSPPPSCTGVRCTLRNPHPPTTVGPTAPPDRPTKPVNPTGFTNPNQPSTGNGPVILERGHESGGGGGHGH